MTQQQQQDRHLKNLLPYERMLTKRASRQGRIRACIMILMFGGFFVLGYMMPERRTITNSDIINAIDLALQDMPAATAIINKEIE